jgi:AraC-like DNA-binding protein
MRDRADEPMLLRFFGCPVRFRAKRDALILDARTLATPFITRNDDLLQVLLPGLDAKLTPRTLLDDVRSTISRRMRGEKPSLEKIARELSMSPRTLQRRLEEHGVSYQTLLDEVRHATALRLLRAKEVEVSEIAFLLGFEELNSFGRAFRAWEGTTPHRWRNTLA